MVTGGLSLFIVKCKGIAVIQISDFAKVGSRRFGTLRDLGNFTSKNASLLLDNITSTELKLETRVPKSCIIVCVRLLCGRSRAFAYLDQVMPKRKRIITELTTFWHTHGIKRKE